MQSRICEVRENWRREDGACLMSVNEITAKPYEILKVKIAVVKSRIVRVAVLLKL
jgi:hypothetical protein